MTDDRSIRFGILDCGFEQKEQRYLIRDFGLRPLRAVGSIYEPEAGGAIMAYTPEGWRISDIDGKI
jgi:hypothetical protein